MHKPMVAQNSSAFCDIPSIRQWLKGGVRRLRVGGNVAAKHKIVREKFSSRCITMSLSLV